MYVPADLLNVPVPVYGVVPPVAETVILPLAPKHKASVEMQLALTCAGCPTVQVVAAEQPLASVTVKV